MPPHPASTPNHRGAAVETLPQGSTFLEWKPIATPRDLPAVRCGQRNVRVEVWDYARGFSEQLGASHRRTLHARLGDVCRKARRIAR